MQRGLPRGREPWGPTRHPVSPSASNSEPLLIPRLCFPRSPAELWERSTGWASGMAGLRHYLPPSTSSSFPLLPFIICFKKNQLINGPRGPTSFVLAYL